MIFVTNKIEANASLLLKKYLHIVVQIFPIKGKVKKERKKRPPSPLHPDFLQFSTKLFWCK